MRRLRQIALLAASLVAAIAVLPSCGLIATFDRSQIVEDAGFPDYVPSPEGGNDVRLQSLALDVAPIVPSFEPGITAYFARYRLPSAHAVFETSRIGITPVAFDPRVSITIPYAQPSPSSGQTSFVPLRASRDKINVSVFDRFGSSRQYEITLDITINDYLKASNTRSNARFGSAVAISGDTLVVGSRDESSNATGVNGDQSNTSLPGAGAAYVFVRSGDTWKQQAYLKGSSLAPNEAFGTSVAISGNTIAVGSPGEISNAGSVRIFTRSGTAWIPQALLRASILRPDDAAYGSGARFGTSIALSGDDLVVGAPEEPSATKGVDGDQSNVSAPGAGAVYTFTRTGTLWTQRAYVKSTHTAGGSRFGASVSYAAGTLAVGSEVGSSVNRGGAAYLFTKSGVSWAVGPFVEASNASRDALFGTAVSLSPSGLRLAVGAEREASAARGIDGDQSDTNADGAGAVYVFVKNGVGWTQEAYVKPSNTQPSIHFGHALSLAENTLAVGAWGESSGAVGFNGDEQSVLGQSSGSVYVFSYNSSWTQTRYVKASNPGNVAFFGDSVALSPSNDALVVGALGEKSKSTGVNGPQTDASLFFAGAVYVY